MAFLRIDKRRRSAGRGVGIAAALVVIGGALYVGVTGPDRAPPARLEAPPIGPCCAMPAASIDPRRVAAPSPMVPAVAGDAASAAQRYRQALLYLDCEALGAVDANGERLAPAQSHLLDPTGALAARTEREAQARREPCRLLGPNEYRQAEALMHAAAQQGDRDAVFFLLERDVRAALALAAAARAQDQPVDERALASTFGDVESMARNGHRDAMVLAAQLITGGQVGPPDPVRAAAWNLVAFGVDAGRPASPSELEEAGLLTSLTPDEAEQAQRQAEALRIACCEVALPRSKPAP